MKRNNVAKTFGIASLCLATAISAFSGISSFNAGNVALAEDVQTTDWVTVSEGATAAIEDRIVYLKKNTSQGSKPCLKISSEVPYEGTFNRVFQNNTTFRFSFCDTKPDDATDTNWGKFTFRVTDASDENNFFDIVYIATSNGTTMYVEWNGHTVNAHVGSAGKSNTVVGDYFYDDVDTRALANVAPAFMQYASTGYAKREGHLRLIWSGDVLTVLTNGTTKQDTGDSITAYVAKFDGSYDETAGAKCGFSNGSKWGLPKMTFPNGYKISFSSSYTHSETTDQASDISFWKIGSDGTSFTFDSATMTKNNHMQAYDLLEANAGKTLLGWKDATGALYPTATALASDDISVYTPVFLGFERIPGASVRIDTSVADTEKSGLRFITGFNVDDWSALLETGYVQSFGTLLAYKENLTEGIFDTVNYATALTDGTKVVQVASGSNGGSTFEYTHGGNTYTAYSVALTNLSDFTQEYSARGYIVVAYADGTTATIYTAFDETNNTRSVAQTAYNLKTIGAAEYNTYTAAQKAIVDTYAAPLETVE